MRDGGVQLPWSKLPWGVSQAMPERLAHLSYTAATCLLAAQTPTEQQNMVAGGRRQCGGRSWWQPCHVTLHWLSNCDQSENHLSTNALVLSPVGADPQHREADHVQRGRQQRRGDVGARAARRQQLPRHYQVHRQVPSNSKGKPSVCPRAAEAHKKWYAVGGLIRR